jgi:hypothetical protein
MAFHEHVSSSNSHPRVTKTSNVKQPKLKDNHASVQQEPEDDEFQTMLPEKGPF